MSLEKALKYANRVVELLAPHCDKIDIAGSIRRQKPYPKDVEIVCLPKRIKHATDLFGGGPMVVCHEFENAIAYMMDYKVIGSVSGRMLQFVVKGHVKIDLFMPAPEDYYRQLAIRTGPFTYSQFVLAYAWRKLGWVGTGDHGLRKIEDCGEISSGDKTKWKLVNPFGEIPPAWQSEEAFFEWLGLEWVDPTKREMKNALNISQ